MCKRGPTSKRRGRERERRRGEGRKMGEEGRGEERKGGERRGKGKEGKGREGEGKGLVPPHMICLHDPWTFSMLPPPLLDGPLFKSRLWALH